MDYYQKDFYLAQVDEDDNLIGPVERWQAHQQPVLHRGFTLILVYKNQLILQHRRHKAFDGYYDLTFSSHPVYINKKLQTMEETIKQGLQREWSLQSTDLKTKINFVDKFYYRAKDSKSIYTEHEFDYLYWAETKKLPKINQDFAYGYELINSKPVSDFDFRISSFNLCPWVKKIITLKSFQELLQLL